MILFILCLIVLIAAVVVALAAGGNLAQRWAGIGFAVLALLGILLSTNKSVPTKSIGVVTSFGSVSGTLSPGANFFQGPWETVHVLDETIQTTTFEDNGQDNPGAGQCAGGLVVRIGGQQSACADVTIQWRILPSAADSLFNDYANQGDIMRVITDAVVVRELKYVVNNVIGDYNPITDVQNISGTNSATSQFSGFGPTILKQMTGDIGSRIEVRTVLLPFVHYSSAVEDKLQGIQQASANFAIATENVKVNHEQALAYAQLGTPTLNQLISECLTSTVARPTGFQCFPGTASGLALSGK